MNKTKIEWVKNPDGTQGYTSNPVRGKCPVGCSYCYVNPLRRRFGWHEDIRFYPEELEAIRKHRKPAGIFIGSAIELFHDKTIQYMKPEYYYGIMDTIKMCPQHRFYLLTKQPQNLAKWSPFPDNCWVGVTVCNDGMMTLALTNLANIKAKVRFISIEPHLGFISMKSYPIKGIVDWIIDGAQTKPYKPPKIEWVQEIVEAADKAGVKVFLKNNLKHLLDKVPGGIFFESSIMVAGNQVIEYSPQIRKLRQEMGR